MRPPASASEAPFDPIGYWESRLGDFDLTAVGFRRLGLAYNRWLYRVRARVFRRLLAESGLDVRSASVLDVGSGTGFYVAQWREAGAASVTGSDATGTATDRLRRAFPDGRFERFDITTHPPFPAESFDAVSAFDVLFHIVDDQLYRRALENLVSLLRPGGLLFLSENFVHGPAVAIQHQVSRPAAEIDELISAAGLELVARRPMFVLMNAPVDSRSTVRQGLWRALAGTVSLHEALGFAVGGLVYPFELALVSSRTEGPSTEAAVYRRSSSSSSSS